VTSPSPSGKDPSARKHKPVVVESADAPIDALDDSSITETFKTILIGRPRDLRDESLFKHLSLVAFLAWVGLGADGLSSSCYGPAEAFHSLHGHSYLAVFLAIATVATVFIISACYSHIIEAFPGGGGGYLVATKLLGKPVGLVSGCALLVDYVLTITVSIAAAGDALFGLAPAAWLKSLTPDQLIAWKLTFEIGAVIVLIVLNLRGVKESVMFLLPVFIMFLILHAVLIFGSIGMHLGGLGSLTTDVSREISKTAADPSFGWLGIAALLLRAYSLGGGTYTGIEAVSNSMPVMREPKVQTGKRTMMLMAISLSLTAGGLVFAYLLLGIEQTTGETMNQTLAVKFAKEVGLTGGWDWGFVLATMIAEGALLVVAAQAGFIDGPRVLANMANDSWVPHWFSNLSERLTTQNGIILMGGAALAALWYTGGNVSTLVLMYSINVFLTFSLSMIAMLVYWIKQPAEGSVRFRRLALFGFGALMCITILGITIWEKFAVGGWITLAVTGGCVSLCLLTNYYYRRVNSRLRVLNEQLNVIPPSSGKPNLKPIDRDQPTAIVLVGGYGGLGIHTFLNVVKFAPNHHKNFVFVSVGVVDSGVFKGEEELADLRLHTAKALEQYVKLARDLGFPAESYMAIGADVVDELENVCVTVAKKYPKSTVFAGQLVFQRDAWYQHLLHNQTAFALQRRLQWDGMTMVILPTRVRNEPKSKSQVNWELLTKDESR
jgi:amino acid transporter